MPLYDPSYMQRKAASAVTSPVRRSGMQTSGRGDLLASEPEYATRYGRPVGQQTSNRGGLLTMDADPSRSQSMLMNLDPEYIDMLNGIARGQGGAVSNPVTGQTVSTADALARAAAIRRAREMQQPNVAAQAPSGVSGRPVANSSGSRLLDMIGTGQGNQDLRGGAGIANRFVQMGGRRTVEARERRAASLMDLMGQEQAGNQAMDLTRLEQAMKLETARENTRGRTMSAIGNMGALNSDQRKQADTNGDGLLDPKERLTMLEKLAKLEQGAMIDDTGKQRPFSPGEALYRTALEQMVNPPEGDGFDGGPFPGNTDMVVRQPGVTQLPREAPANAGQAALTPSQAYVDRLRQLRGNPEAVAAFERRFGAGSSAQYLQ